MPVIDRNVDILERIGMEVDQVSQKIFETRRSRGGSSRVYQGILYTIGRKERSDVEGSRKSRLNRAAGAFPWRRKAMTCAGQGHARAAQDDAARRCSRFRITRLT